MICIHLPSGLGIHISLIACAHVTTMYKLPTKLKMKNKLYVCVAKSCGFSRNVILLCTFQLQYAIHSCFSISKYF